MNELANLLQVLLVADDLNGEVTARHAVTAASTEFGELATEVLRVGARHNTCHIHQRCHILQQRFFGGTHPVTQSEGEDIVLRIDCVVQFDVLVERHYLDIAKVHKGLFSRVLRQCLEHLGVLGLLPVDEV